MTKKELIDEITEVFEDLEKENESLEVLIKEVNSEKWVLLITLIMNRIDYHLRN